MSAGPTRPASRWLAEQFGQRFGKKPVFDGHGGADAWLVNIVRVDPAVRLAARSAGADDRLDRRLGRARTCRASARTRISIRAMAPTEPAIGAPLAAAELARRRGAGARGRLEPGRRRLGDFPRARHRSCRARRRRVVATAATLPYGKFAWVSMVLVAGEQRRHGLGTQLLNRCIAALSEQGRVPVLDATPAGCRSIARSASRRPGAITVWRGPTHRP